MPESPATSASGTALVHDIEDLRVAFTAICGIDFSQATLEQMSQYAQRRLEELEAGARAGNTDAGFDLESDMIRELLTMATGRAAALVVH